MLILYYSIVFLLIAVIYILQSNPEDSSRKAQEVQNHHAGKALDMLRPR